jgi:excisionase family DNA binding protein
MGKIIETYTIDEVAESLKLHPYTVRRLCREKKIPAFKFGGQWRFHKEEIDAMVQQGHSSKGKSR